jgi:hypothetical protein
MDLDFDTALMCLFTILDDLAMMSYTVSRFDMDAGDLAAATARAEDARRLATYEAALQRLFGRASKSSPPATLPSTSPTSTATRRRA